MPQSAGSNGHLPCKMHRQTEKYRERERAAAGEAAILCTRLCAFLRPIFCFMFAKVEVEQCSRLKSSMPFRCNLALQNIPPSKQPFKMQPQTKHEDVT